MSDDDDDDDIFDLPVSVPKPRRAAVPKKAYVLDVDSDDEVLGNNDNDSESAFEESD